MSVPDYQSMMTPLLNLLADGREWKWSQAKEEAASQFGLSEEQRSEMLPSGRQTIFDNRIGWAATYLSQAGLVERPARGFLRITQRGRQSLDSGSRVDTAYLRQFPEFEAFRSRAKERKTDEQDAALTPDRTPEELIETGYQVMRTELAQEVLDRLATVSPRFFEQLVVRLLVRMGYGGSLADAGQAVGRSGDDGIDGIIKEDKLGLDVVYIQAKRWSNTVGRPEIQAFAGSLMGQGAGKGVFITTSKFSADAVDYVRRIDKRIVLIDGEHLAELMIDYGIGVAETATYSICRLDEDFFSDE